MAGRLKARLRRAAGVVILAALASACAREDIGPAKYSAEACRRVALVDQATGQVLLGAEDFAVDTLRRRLYVAAYDRRAAERAAKKKAMIVPQGGVYVVSFDILFDPSAEKADARPIVSGDDIAGGVRPQGISYDSTSGEIAFINRAYQKINGGWLMTPRIERVGANGEAFVGADEPAPCSANSILDEDGFTLVSFDHAECGIGAGFEDVFRLKRSGVVGAEGDVLFSKAAFANGLARTLAGDLVLAATRENALIVMQKSPEGLAETARIALPGGPDNLKIAEDGGVIAAVHPSMFRIFLNRRLGLGRAPSRIIKADPERGDVSILFDDDSGKSFSAATAAVEVSGHLVAGSVTDKGLLVCKAGA
ncbi:MAG: hypothetical protein RIE56_00475 [Amphiplicatus sp.]